MDKLELVFELEVEDLVEKDNKNNTKGVSERCILSRRTKKLYPALLDDLCK